VGWIVSQRLIEANRPIFLVVLDDGDIAIFVVSIPFLPAMPDDRNVRGLLEHLELAARVACTVEDIGSVADAVGVAAAGQMRFRNHRAFVAIEFGNGFADSVRALLRKLLKRVRFLISGAYVGGRRSGLPDAMARRTDINSERDGEDHGAPDRAARPATGDHRRC